MNFLQKIFTFFFPDIREEKPSDKNGTDLKPVTIPGNLLLPEKFREIFDVKSFSGKKNEWEVKAIEKSGQFPEELKYEKKENIVLNGFCDMVEIIDFPFKGIPLYIQFYRRKWKIKGKQNSFSNNYEFHPKGMKASHEFGFFLKGLSRQERSEFFRAWPNLRLIREKDF